MDPCAKPDPGQTSHHSGEGQCASTGRNLPGQGLALMVSSLLFREDVHTGGRAAHLRSGARGKRVGLLKLIDKGHCCGDAFLVELK